MNKNLLLKVLLSLIFVLLQPPTGFAIQQNSSEKEKPQASKKTDDEVVKISVTLVQVDVTVTDSKGNLVTDLNPEDFELYEDGRLQKISHFSQVVPKPLPPSGSTPTKEQTAKTTNHNIPPPPPSVRLKSDQVRRTVALVVDDLTLSLESTNAVRQALRRFVDEQMQPGDLVAIIRTGAGMGALQMFTADKKQLYAAIERVRWNPGYAQINTFEPVGPGVNTAPRSALNQSIPQIVQYEKSEQEKAVQGFENFREEVFAAGTLGALGFLVRGLKALPGRKSIVLLSDGFKLYDPQGSILRIQDALRHLTEQANRAAVNIYTIDARGLQPLGFTAADDLSGDFDSTAQGLIEAPGLEYARKLLKREEGRRDRFSDFIESQEGLRRVAQDTGGFFVKNTNDLNKGIKRALDDQEGYYLLGYLPDESTFKKGNNFHEIQIKLKRPGLRVRTRTGFFGITNEEMQKAQKESKNSILSALTSPFNSGDIGLRLTSSFGHDPKAGHYIRSILHIDAHDLAFSTLADGSRQCRIEIAAFTFGDNGKAIDQSDLAYVVQIPAKDFQRSLDAGLFYTITLPLKKPGAYQLRTAVRDVDTLHLGSANQFIEVPDLKQNRLALSGIILSGYDKHTVSESNTPATSARAQVASTSSGRIEERDPLASPAVRKFKQGMVLEYAYLIFNAKLNKATNRPQLETQMLVFRDAKQVFAGKVSPFDANQQTDMNRLIGGGSFLIGQDLLPGEYAFQIVVTDKLAKENQRMLTQWIDFEVVK